MLNIDQTIISQYATSPTIVAIIESLNAAIDPSGVISSFVTNVLDPTTATGYGLDRWGRIVGVGRNLVVAITPTFGFDEATTGSASPFNQGTFYNGGGTSGAFRLADSAYRTVVLAKALANICDGSIVGINTVLRSLFPGRGNSYIIDNRNLTYTYRFAFATTAVEQAIMLQSGVLPRIAGRTYNVVFS